MSLAHRGPDQQGVYETERVSLGVARLRIIDLDGGDQPIYSADGDTVIVFNGEVYNYREVRRELEGLGHRFRTHSDTEVVLEAFRQWDVDGFRRLRGMFAAALWNESRRRLVLARDRLGIKPLYYHRRGGELYFGSELKAILVHPEVERRLDLKGLDHYLSLNYVPCPHTLVEGIRKLPPGHWLEWQEGRVRMEPYWRLRFEPQARWTLPAAIEALDRLLKEAVREHLISDVPLGVWASGGLDSSTILHYAAAATSGRLRTFSVSFAGRRFDESRYFRQVAERYGTEHHEWDLSPSPELAGAIEEMAYYSDEPSADAGALPVWFLSRMSRRHVTVALSGEGADELFGGYITYEADRWARRARRVPAPLRRLALRAAAWWPVSDEKVSLEYKFKRFLEGAQLEADEAHCYWNGAFSSAQKRDFYAAAGVNGAGELFQALPPEAGRCGYVNRYLWFDQLYYLPDDILYKCDRMSMAHSLEVRPPFLDHRIVELAASLPEDFKVRGGRLKYVLRELMRGKLPEAVLRRKKEGFDIPAHEWLRGLLRPLLEDTLTEDAIRRAGVFRVQPIRAAMRRHLERRANLGFHLWGLLTLFLWMERWKVRGEAPERSGREAAAEQVFAAS
jgi:asparagine synthase (glutamine-hydrolysing)